MTRKVRYVGLDVHKSVIEACIMSKEGTILERLRFELTRESLLEFAKKSLQKTDKVALEATTNSWSVLRLLKTVIPDVFVSNPGQTKAIAHARLKSDKVDAEMLAHLLRSDFLPLVWQPDQATQDLRSITSRRVALVQERTAAKNRIQSALHEVLVAPPSGIRSVFSKAGHAWLKQEVASLPRVTGLSIESDLRLLEGLNDEIELLEGELYREGNDDVRLKLLVTLPGVDVIVAQAMLAAIGDVSRFSSAAKAASYFGLTPRIRQSASTTRYGKISKAGTSHGRFMMVQAAWSCIKAQGPLAGFYKRLSNKKPAGVAIVGVARKLVTYAWHMLTNNEPYRYGSPSSVSAKLARIRTRGGGPLRKSANGGPLAVVRNTEDERIIPGIGEVYEAEGLPPHTGFDDLAPGEKKMLRSKRIVRDVRKLAKETRKPRRRRDGSRKGSEADSGTI